MDTLTDLEQKVIVRRAIDQFIEFLNQAEAKFIAERFPTLKADTFWVDAGKKYLRIAQGNADGTGARVHCFIDALTGDVYKAATWKAPALNGARYNLLDEASLEKLKQVWDPYGSYLYKR